MVEYLGSDWVDRTGNPAYQFQALNNAAVPQAGWAGDATKMPVSSYAHPMLFTDHKITATMKTPAADDIALLYLRSNNANQVVLIALNNARWFISTVAGTYSQLATNQVLRQYDWKDARPFADGETITFEAVGNCYQVYKNGFFLFRWVDDEGIYAPYVDAAHRECAIGYLCSTVQGAFDRVDMDDLYIYPSLTGTDGDGTLTATHTGPHHVVSGGDEFTRANSTTSAGPNWINRAGTVGVTGNTAYPVGAGWNATTFEAKMTSDDAELSVLMGPLVGDGTIDHTMINLGANVAGESCLAYFITGNTWYFYTVTSWALAGGVVQATGPVSYTAGDRMGYRRVGNVYTLTKNGIDIPGAVWTDSGNLIPRSNARRFQGITVYTDGTGKYRRVEDFQINNKVTMSSDGTLSATMARNFTPFSETNTNRSNQAVPAGTFGAWVTLVAGGGGGGSGSGGSFSARAGGGGGGGGAIIQRSFVPRSAMGSVYSVARGLGGAAGAAGGVSGFASSPMNIQANGGTQGGNASGGTQGTAGAGGTCVVSGATVTQVNGGAGAIGGPTNANAAAGANTTTACPGGGGGGGRDSIGTSRAGGKGGNSSFATGGNGAGAGGSQGSPGGNTAVPNPGGGGGGGAGSNGNTVTGGAAGVQGAGGGGGGGGNSVFTGGPGGDGYTLIEWT